MHNTPRFPFHAKGMEVYNPMVRYGTKVDSEKCSPKSQFIDRVYKKKDCN